MSIVEHLREPEGKTRENKRGLSSPTPVVRSLVAFANTSGGILIVGVEDDGTVVGLAAAQREEERLSSLIADSILPVLQPDIEITSVDGVDLLVVRVAKQPAPFYVTQEGPAEGVYVRVGSTNRKASREKVEELRLEAARIAFDERSCAGTGPDDLDMDRVREAFAAIGREPNPSRLVTMRLLTQVGRKQVPSNGGIILFGKEDARAKLVPDAAIRCARFDGTKPVNFLDSLDVEGTVLDGIAQASAFIKRNTRTASKIAGLKREDVPEYASVALREALVNAVAHSDYSMRGTKISVAVFDDRLVIQSPGMLPFGMTLDDIKEGVSRIRNPVVARFLKELGLMEQWGTGYERIVAECEKQGHPVPVWEEVGETIRVTFRPHPETISAVAGKEAVGRVGDQVGTKSGLSGDQVQVLETAKEPKAIGELMEAVGRTNRTKFRDSVLKPLLEARHLAMTIPDKPRSRNQRYITTEAGRSVLERD